MLLSVFVLALALELVGIGFSLKEYLDARQRWRERFTPQPPPLVRRGGRNLTGYGKATWSPPEPESVDERIAQLESRLAWHVKAIRKRIDKLSDSVPVTAEKAAAKVESRLEPQLVNLIGYLAGSFEQRSRWRPWWLGPLLLILGVFVGFVGSVLSVLVE